MSAHRHITHPDRTIRATATHGLELLVRRSHLTGGGGPGVLFSRRAATVRGSGRNIPGAVLPGREDSIRLIAIRDIRGSARVRGAPVNVLDRDVRGTVHRQAIPASDMRVVFRGNVLRQGFRASSGPHSGEVLRGADGTSAAAREERRLCLR